ncbi:hypothetical protein J1605_001311 [Eschrichtius robustus]|uniref:Phospholipid scramblase n=1 Tax=Eschrichtius robustus TaxID=9764 RepID=A0AB34G7A6_ESCRO|nr:hypothetical protein J1605_001311 [Eschrichtius robustus]
MQSEYLILPPGYSVVGAVGIPVQFQPVSLQTSVPARLLWIPKLPPSSDCPPGLEYLNQVDQIQIHQQIELTEEMNKLMTFEIKIEIYAPPGIPIGYVIQTWHPYLPKFTIQNENKKDVLRIIGPYFVCNTCGNVEFKVRDVIYL